MGWWAARFWGPCSHSSWAACDGVALRLLPDALGDLWRYGWPRVPSDVAELSILALGPWMASYCGGMAEAGFLLAGQAIFQITNLATKSFGIVMLPRVAALHAEGQVEYLREMVSDVLVFVGHVGLYAMLHLLVWSRVLILVWLGATYADAVLLARLLLVAVIPYTAYVMLRSIIDAVEQRPVNTINLGIALLGVILASLLALMFGWGAAGLALSTSLGYWLLGACPCTTSGATSV